MNKAVAIDKKTPAAVADGVPEGERPQVDEGRRSRWRDVRRAFRRRPPPARRRGRADARRAEARRRRMLVLGLHADEDDAAHGRAGVVAGAGARAGAGADRPGRRLELARLDDEQLGRHGRAALARGAALRVRARPRACCAARRGRGGGQELEYDRLVIATGTSPAIPPIPGLDTVEYWTNQDAASTHEIPASLAVMGGGPVGVRAGAVLRPRRLEGDTSSSAGARLLGRVHEDAGELSPRSCAARGSSSVSASGSRRSAGRSAPSLRRLDGRGRAAAGRDRPAAERGGLGLERSASGSARAGSRSTSGCAPPRTSGRWATSAGSPCSPTSASTRPGSPRRTSRDGRPGPTTARSRPDFTDPEVATVGRTDGDGLVSGAGSWGRRLASRRTSGRSATASSSLADPAAGPRRRRRRRPAGRQWLGQLTLAVRSATPVEVLVDTIQPYPTFSEAIFFALRDLVDAL